MGYDKSNKLHIVAVTAVIRNAEGKCLVLKRSEREIAHPGKYTFPGGKIEGNDSVEETLQAEVQEEVGLRLKPGKILLKDASFVRPDGQTVKVFSYLCELEGPANVTLDEHDFTDYRWVSFADLQQLPHVGIEEELKQAERLAALTPTERSRLQTKSQRNE